MNTGENSLIDCGKTGSWDLTAKKDDDSSLTSCGRDGGSDLTAESVNVS